MKAPLSTFLGVVGLLLSPCLTARAQVPTGGQVVAGAATIAQSGSAMTITQASRHAIVNWQSFNLGADATLRLQQNGADAALLARVTGGDPSKLLGTLKADGKLFLINPKGVLVGEGAVIDTAAFLASTLDVSDADFLRGSALTFKGGSAAGILNLGTITAREGNVLLLAHTVKNTGSITAPNGTAGLASGSEIYLASPDAPDFVIQASLPESGAEARTKTGVDNSGVIAAAQARLEAAGGSLYELAINQSGIVRATGTATVNGRVLLTAAGGTVGVSGQVSARNPNGAGGEILVGGDAHGANPAVANATHTVITTTGVLDASAATPSAAAGRVIVWSDGATRFLGTVRATGTDGGFAEVSGRHGLDFRPASAVQLGAGGTLLLDPDALVVSAGATSGTTGSGSDPFTFGASTEPATLNVATLQDQLATTNVILDTSASTGDITFASPVAWTSDRALTVRSGNNINLNASLTGGAASTLVLSPGRRADAPPESGLPDIQGEVQIASDATVTVGTLRYGANAASSPGAGYTMTTPAAAGVFFAHGNLHVDALEIDLSAGEAGVVADGSDNAIGAFRTTGTGTLSSAYVVDHHGGLDVTLNSSTAGGPYLQFITPGTLALKAGSQLDFASSGTVLLASTSGAFVNEAGAAVFGDHARFLIYSSTTSATTKGGLSGTEVFSHPFSASDDYSSDTISRFFYTAASGAPILTYTASDLTRTYGAANPSFTYTTTGWLDGVTNDVTGSPALSTTATQSSGVGAYTINIGAGSLASSNYDFAFVPGTLTIERAPLTITATDATRRVNRANPAFGVTYAGFVLGQDASALSGTLSITTPATAASPVGHYTITPAGLTSSNYAITFVPGTLAVTATASLLITADDVSRTYGAGNPTFTATYHGLVEGDDASVVTGLQFSTTATQSSGVGTYAITPFGASATAYDINYASGTLTITRAPLTISIPNQSRLYGDPNDFTVAFNGLVNGDTSAVITGLSLTSTATPSSGVGTYPILAAGATAANYSISYAPGSLSILPTPLVVNIGNATRAYGDADPAFTYTLAGLKNGDSADGAVSVTGPSSLAAAEAGVGAYGIVGFASALSPNYSVTTNPGTLTITPRPITITAEDKTRVYGDANPAFTATFAGLAPFDTPAIFGPLSFSSPATVTSGAGAWGITFPSVRNPNYAVTSVFGTLTITPAPLTLGPLDDVSRLYGRADPLLTLPTVAGLRNDDTVAGLGLTFRGVPAATADVGSYTYTVAATNPNYTFTAPAATFRIDPAPLTVAITPTGRLYGDANPSAYEFTANGLAFGQTAGAVLSIQNPTGTGTAVGTYALTPVLNTRNYYVSAVTGGDFKINPRVLTLDLPYYARYYGDANPAFFIGDILVGGDGLAAFDTITSLVPALHTAAPTDAQSNTGYYRIDPTFSANPNYRYSWTPGYLAVMPRPVEVSVGNGVSFGNNNVPPDFNPATLDAELITFDAAHPQGTGYRIEISNLPAFASPADLAAHIGIAHSDANTPQTVGVAVPLDQVPFPARPDRTKPVAAADPIPDDQLGIITIPLTQVMPTSPTTTSPLDALTGNVIFSGGTFIVDLTGTKADERFADLIRYLLPQPSLGGNYVVTAIHNGKLTMKSDPVVVQHTLDAEAIVAKRRAAEESFLTGTTGGLSIRSTFGLTPDEFPLIREAFVNMLFDLTRTDPTNDFLRILAGGANKVTDINQVSNDAILFWLADIHTNPAKQALLAPAMASYGVKLAGLSPSQRTPLQQKLVDQMTPYLAEARGQFIDDVQAARQAWVDVQTGNTNLSTLTGAEVPYEKFIQSGVEKTVSKAFNGLQTQSGSLTETDAMHMLGLASGTLVGVGAGAIAAQTVAASLGTIFPKMGAGMAILAQRAGEVAADVSEAITGFEASSGVFAVVSTAVTIGITKAIAVGEEEKQRQNFETLLASRNGPVDAHAMSETEQGHAILTLGLLKMFGGG